MAQGAHASDTMLRRYDSSNPVVEVTTRIICKQCDKGVFRAPNLPPVKCRNCFGSGFVRPVVKP